VICDCVTCSACSVVTASLLSLPAHAQPPQPSFTLRANHHCPCCVLVCCPLPPPLSYQGKIKGSYTASKMLEFSVRGTLSSAQLVLGIDKDLPYLARQVRGRDETMAVALRVGATCEACPAECLPCIDRPCAGRLARATKHCRVSLTHTKVPQSPANSPTIVVAVTPCLPAPKHRTWVSTAAWMMC
jgi:hypothetical protein